jgi:hypothetical protein
MAAASASFAESAASHAEINASTLTDGARFASNIGKDASK